jgi:sarcosine oxidase
MPASTTARGSGHAPGPRVVVIGAGAFGGWTALELLRRGARVTLLDAWGPGHARSSSGGETRVIRATYGSRAIYTNLTRRAIELWRRYDERWQAGLLRTTGCLWMFGADDAFGRASMATLHDAGMAIDELSRADAARRFPQIAFDEAVATILWEPEAGYLFAARACASIVERFRAEGGAYRQAAVRTPVIAAGHPLQDVALESGERIEADAFVFACGPWLGRVFPDVVGARITPTRQEVYYFGTPAGDRAFDDPAMPVWLDCGERIIYGIPGNGGRGFKIADDTPGPPFNPTDGDRNISDDGVARARAFLARRFPRLANAPLLGGEVCQYEATPDAHFIVDRHPAAVNVWLLGGGSGHGFKMGPVIGELAASCVLDAATPDPQMALGRFAAPPPDGWQKKWS